MKKKILAAILGGMLVLTGVNISHAPVTAQAEELTYGDFTYTLSGGLTITEYTGDGGNVIIPDKINNVDVTKIGYKAFNGCTSLSSVTLPARLQEIGSYAFSGTGITDITIPKSVTSADQAFDGADSLINAEFESGSTGVPGGIFSVANNLTTVTLPDSMTQIGDDSFADCTKLTTINLPSKITKIGYKAFNGCTSLSSITLPARLQEIGSYAFSGTGITDITIPKSVTSADQAFDGADSLINAEFESGSTGVPGGIFSVANNLTTVTLPDSMRQIGDDSFAGCTKLTTINLPSKITKIGYKAFNGCTSLSSITLPARLQEIGSYAFSGTGITDITIPKSVTSADQAFDGADSLISAEFESGSTGVPGGIFSVADNLTTVTLPDSMTQIGDDSFAGCTKLTTINPPGKITKMGYKAFNGCASLNKILISSKVKEIGDYAFDGCDSLTIYGPKNSYAQTYAKENNIEFVESSDTSADEPSSDDYTNAAPTVTIKSTGKNNIKIKYSKPANTSKFEFNYRKKGASSWKKKTTTKTSVNLKGLKRKTSYQIRVRSIRTVDGTDYSGTWSVIKTVKTK